MSVFFQLCFSWTGWVLISSFFQEAASTDNSSFGILRLLTPQLPVSKEVRRPVVSLPLNLVEIVFSSTKFTTLLLFTLESDLHVWLVPRNSDWNTMDSKFRKHREQWRGLFSNWKVSKCFEKNFFRRRQTHDELSQQYNLGKYLDHSFRGKQLRMSHEIPGHQHQKDFPDHWNLAFS